MNKYFLKTTLLLIVIGWLSGCDMDIQNPNAATAEEAYNSQNGLIAVSVGMRSYFSTDALSNIIITPGVTAYELGAFTTFVNYLNLEEGGDAIQNDNSLTKGLWTDLYRIVAIAEQITANVDVIEDAGVKAGVQAHANFFKAISLGYLIQAFEMTPITTSETGDVEFLSRDAVLAECIRLLEEAQSMITTNPPPQSFYDATGPDFDWPNMINAYLSRYYLMDGDYESAITAADEVDLSSASYFVFSNNAQNPIWNNVVNTTGWRPLDFFGLDSVMIDTADMRTDFYLAELDTTSAQNKLPVDDLAAPFFASQTSRIPVYLPGEVLLNKAEAYARTGNVEAAVTALNMVRTKTAATDAVGIGAGLTPYAGAQTAEAVLDDIYLNRNIELFMTGMRLEDSKRFGKPGPGEPNATRNRNFYPYPDTEKSNNPNTPQDPAI